MKLKVEDKLVVVTGADSGLGLLTAQDLKTKGYEVLAVCFLPENVAKRRDEDKMEAIQADLTVKENVESVSKLVKDIISAEGGRLRLWALINCAGRLVPGMTEWLTIEDFRNTFDINFFAVVNMTLALLPELKKTRKSRVVNISSTAGFVNPPGNGPYNTSKHAVESFSDTLRLEMRPWGVQVAIIQPGMMRTDLALGYADRFFETFKRASDSVQNEYGEDFAKSLHGMEKYAQNPLKAVKTIVHACTSNRCRHRYKSGFDARWIFGPLSRLPTRVQDYMFEKYLSFPTKPAALNT